MSKVKTWQERVLRNKNALPKREMQAEIDELRAKLADVTEQTRQILLHRDHILEVNGRLTEKLAELEQEAAEEDALRERLSELLTKSVNAIRGEPAELSLHSWHDLPELCNGLMEKLARGHDDFIQTLTDPENQPSQWGTVTLAMYQGVEAERDALAADAERLNHLIDNRAYIVSDASCCDGYWLHYERPDGSTWFQSSEYETPRAAIDAAIKANHAR